MKKIFYSLTILFLLSASILVGKVSAQSRLQYPIPDLGYCRDAKECSLYCQIPENKAPCWSYGKYKLGSDVLGVSTMSEEEKRQMQQKAKQYNVVFPITDLGGCTGPQECRDFCEQPTNQQTCMDFAKKKGFQKEVNNGTGLDRQKKDELLTKAQTELGCTSMETCSKICESDHTRCEAFARKHGVYQEPSESSGRYSTEKKALLMEKATSELGCTSMESCKSVCEKNPQACMAFAKKHGFDKGSEHELDSSSQRLRMMPSQSSSSANFGTQRFGKGSCESEESCKLYCREHPDECPGLKGYTRAVEGSGSAQVNTKNYVGPSGCRNEAECKSWCETHPDQCPGFSEARVRETNSIREYELKKKALEYQRSPSSGGGTQYYPSTSTQPAYNTTQPSSSSQGSGSTQPPAINPTP